MDHTLRTFHLWTHECESYFVTYRSTYRQLIFDELTEKWLSLWVLNHWQDVMCSQLWINWEACDLHQTLLSGQSTSTLTLSSQCILSGFCKYLKQKLAHWLGLNNTLTKCIWLLDNKFVTHRIYRKMKLIMKKMLKIFSWECKKVKNNWNCYT